MAARTRKTFDGACRKCGERGHKARECGRVGVESGSVEVEEKPTRSCCKPRCRTESGSRIEEKGRKGQRAAERVSKDEAAARRPGTATMAKTTAGMSLATPASSPEPDMAGWQVDDPTADTANPNATHAGPTRPEDESSNPPEALPSTSLEGESQTGTSDELGRVPVDESTTSQSMWMPRDESPSGEVHGVARSHEEAAGVDVEGGEAGERTRTGDDEERRAREHIDDSDSETASRQVDDEATDTPNPHAKCAGPTRPVGKLHDPADELPGEREGGGVAESESEPEAVSSPIEGRSGRMPTDRADEAKPLGDNPSGVAKVRGAKDEVERGSATARTRSTTTADENDQPDEAIVDDIPDEPPTPPAPLDKPAPLTNESPSVELEGRRAATSCDARPTTGDTDASGAPGRDEYDGKRPMKLQTTSGRVSERLKTKGRKCLPGRTNVEPGDPGCEADTSAAPWSIEKVLKKPKKLRNKSERISKGSKRRTREISPDSAREEQSNPDDEAAAPGDVHSDPECHRGKTNERVVETNASRQDKGPRGHMGKLERSRGVEGVRDRGKVVDGAEHDGMCPRSRGNEREVETNA